jgi:hypothetical protein
MHCQQGNTQGNKNLGFEVGEGAFESGPNVTLATL